MLLEDYRPRSQLIAKTALVEKPRFPVIDAHNHLGAAFGGGWINRPLDEILATREQAGVDTSARLGELGRQPYTARRFFIQYADRILFGLDFGIDLAEYRPGC